jgi:CBS domain-containing protein
MKIRDMIGALDQPLGTIGSGQTIKMALKMLFEHNIGLLVVCDEENKISGVLSERDIIKTLHVHGAKSISMEIGDIMTRKVETCSPNSDILSVLERLVKGKFRHMPVVNNGKLVGIVTSRDLIQYFSGHSADQELAQFWSKITWN